MFFSTYFPFPCKQGEINRLLCQRTVMQHPKAFYLLPIVVCAHGVMNPNLFWTSEMFQF